MSQVLSRREVCSGGEGHRADWSDVAGMCGSVGVSVCVCVCVGGCGCCACYVWQCECVCVWVGVVRVVCGGVCACMRVCVCVCFNGVGMCFGCNISMYI